MRRSHIYLLLMGAAFNFANPTWSTATEVIDAITITVPHYKIPATDGYVISAITGNTSTELQGATRGTASSTSTAETFWYADPSNNLYTVSFANGAWRTFKAATVTASWNATTTVTLTEDTRDGAAGPGSPYTIELILTKTGTPVDLTRAVLFAFLRASTTKDIKTAGGATLAATGATLTSGWAAKALMKDGASAAITTAPALLDPIEATITANITTAASVVIPFSARLTDLHTWNVATNATTGFNVTFTAAGSRVLEGQAFPANFVRTASIATGFITAFNAAPTVLNQANNGSLNTLPAATNELLGLIDVSPPANIKAGFNSIFAQIIAATNFAAGDLVAGSKADTNKLGVARLGGNLTTVTWRAEGSNLIAKGTISPGKPKDFTFNLSTIEVVKTGTNEVLQGTSTDGDALCIKCFDATGYDTSADTSVAAADRDALLALQLAGKLSTITTATGWKMIPALTASQ